MEESYQKDGWEQEEQSKEEVAELKEVAEPKETEAKPTPTPDKKQAQGWLVLGWSLFVITLVIAFFLGAHLLRLREQVQALSQEVSQLRSAVTSARKVFLERAVAELGYASVDLQADPPKRYQVAFRLEEASRWLRDAESLLSPSGRAQVQSILQTLNQLPIAVEQDPVSARKELAKVQDALEQLLKAETMLQ